MGDLRELDLKSCYWYDRDDILFDLYLPALSAASACSKVTGPLSSETLSDLAKNLPQFARKGGRTFLITSIVLPGGGTVSAEDIVKNTENRVLKEIGYVKDEAKRDGIALLGWMLKTGNLQIKIAVVPEGAEAPEIGILEDNTGNRLSFAGSGNSAVHAFRSWDESGKYVDADLGIFAGLWKCEAKKTKVYPASEMFTNGLIRFAPDDEAAFLRLARSMSERLMGQRRKSVVKKDLRKYQEEAVNAWLDSGAKGILEMAPATGKTFTSVHAIEALSIKTGKLLAVIVVPHEYQISLWKKELTDFFGYDFAVKEVRGDMSQWPEILEENIKKYASGEMDRLAILTMYNTFSTSRFQDLAAGLPGGDPQTLLVADEVRFMNFPEFRSGMKDTYRYRLGLSAVPRDWLEDAGEDTLKQYFGGTVYSFTLQDAIPEFLSPYSYFPQTVEMGPAELSRYAEKAGEDLERLSRERARVILENPGIRAGFERIIQDLKEEGQVNHLLVYCRPEQLDWVTETLKGKDIPYHRLDLRESREERRLMLERFKKGSVAALCAARCLDQGLEMPAAKTVIFLAADSSPAQYIQRRGKVLLKDADKEQTDIYDFIVLPAEGQTLNRMLYLAERKLFDKQLAQAQIFYVNARNSSDVMPKMRQIASRYDLELKETSAPPRRTAPMARLGGLGRQSYLNSQNGK